MKTAIIEKTPLLVLGAFDWNNEGENIDIHLQNVIDMEISDAIVANSGNVLRNCISQHKITKVFQNEDGILLIEKKTFVDDEGDETSNSNAIWIEL